MLCLHRPPALTHFLCSEFCPADRKPFSPGWYLQTSPAFFGLFMSLVFKTRSPVAKCGLKVTM